MIILKATSKWILALLFVGAGINHFAHTAFYVHIMPPSLPWPRTLVYLSGVCESGLGFALLFRRVSRWAAWGLIALLFAVFPANWYMAAHPERFSEFPAVLLKWRAPLQALLVAWVYWHTRPERPAR